MIVGLYRGRCEISITCTGAFEATLVRPPAGKTVLLIENWNYQSESSWFPVWRNIFQGGNADSLPGNLVKLPEELRKRIRDVMNLPLS
jgi:hypothetical protein